MSGPLLVIKLAKVAERHEQIQGIRATREDETPIAYCRLLISTSSSR